MSNSKIVYGITMSAELCDNFPNRKVGAKYIVEACNSSYAKSVAKIMIIFMSFISHICCVNAPLNYPNQNVH